MRDCQHASLPATMPYTSTAHVEHARPLTCTGAGILDLLGAAQGITDYIPHASTLPPRLDLLPCSPHGGQVRHPPRPPQIAPDRPRSPLARPSLAFADLPRCSPHGGQTVEAGDGYMWPHCAQPLYHSAMPTLINLTIPW